MKKNVMLRLSAVLLVAVLLTTCVISGTWAKYVTSGNAEDSARVAKWGVTISANATNAEVTETDGSAEAEVATDSGILVLAPGTKAATLADFTITGTPEVAVKVEYVATLTLEGWFVGPDYYCPLVINVNGTEISGLAYSSAADFKAAVEDAINDLGDEYPLGQDLSGVEAPEVFVLWAYQGNDAKDTALGDKTTAPTVSLAITATVTQIN